MYILFAKINHRYNAILSVDQVAGDRLELFGCGEKEQRIVSHGLSAMTKRERLRERETE